MSNIIAVSRTAAAYMGRHKPVSMPMQKVIQESPTDLQQGLIFPSISITTPCVLILSVYAKSLKCVKTEKFCVKNS